MLREPEVALVFTPEPWVEELHHHFTDHGGVRVRQIVMDPTLALEEPYETLVVSHRWPALTRGLVDALHDRHRRVLGVYEREEPAGRDHLEGLGVDRTIESDAAPLAFQEALVGLGPLRRLPQRSGPTSAPSGPPNDRHVGWRLVVGGPAGGGATEVAVHLAAFASRKGRAVVVDADEVAPAVAQRLALPIEPNLRTAVDAVEHGLGELGASLVPVGPTRLHALVGLPNVAAWSQVRPNEVLAVLEQLARAYDQVVVDVGNRLEDLGGGGRTRYALTRALVADADQLALVGDGSPVGIARLLAWTADAHALAKTTPIHLVVNRAPRESFRRAEIEQEIARTAPPASLSFLPTDLRVGSAAWSGELAGRGPFARALERLFRTVLLTVRSARGGELASQGRTGVEPEAFVAGAP